MHTIEARGGVEGSTIRSTIATIECNTCSKARRAWEKIYPDEEPGGFFVAKVDVSEIPFSKVQAALRTFERELLAQGDGIYSIDCTQDFSGTLDREALVAFLRDARGFGDKKTFVEAMGETTPTILDNTDSVGKNCCTWIGETDNGSTARWKLYNKVVSNFEAGEVRSQFGGHLAEYADCPNQHLRQTFLHPDVQARGCTRAEISMYGCEIENILAGNVVQDVVQEVLDLVSKEDEQHQQQNQGLFVVQPPQSSGRTSQPT